MEIRPKLLIVEDQSVIALDLEETLSKCDYEVVAIAGSAQEAFHFASRFRPDVVLMDVHLRGVTDGIDAAQVMTDRYDIPVVFLTAHVDAGTIGRAHRTLPYGFISKPWRLAQLDSTIRIAIQQHARIRGGSEGTAPTTSSSPSMEGFHLTPRQVEVIKLVAAGKANKEIANDLNVSVKTINFHKANLMDLLGLRTTAELTRFAVRSGFVKL